jgi:SecD/SecF fusion protein
VRREAARLDQAGAVIQGRGEATDGDYSRFQIRSESLTAEESERLQDALTDAIGATSFSEQTVSESFGGQIANAAILAILVSLMLIVLYMAFRFHWHYSVGVLVALAHDVIITVGFYALTGREVSTATVAAVLTVLGYSIYDTIIIFDRIRENVPLMRRASIRVIGNVSLWEVLPRSLATTFITLVPVAALYFFGGDTLKDFAFALLVGIGFGAYSSVFLAAPLLAVLKQREPEFAKRRDDLGALAGVESIGGVLLDDIEAEGDEDEAPEGDGRPPAPVEPEPDGAPPATPAPAGRAADKESKRERRRQRRASRPHGRTR